MVFKNLDKYLGEISQGRPHGKGTYVWGQSGAIFEGCFKDGGISEAMPGQYTFRLKFKEQKADIDAQEYDIDTKLTGKDVYLVKGTFGSIKAGDFEKSGM